MPKVKTTYAYKTQSIVKEFSDEFMESINNQLYCNLCYCAVSCNKGFLTNFQWTGNPEAGDSSPPSNQRLSC